MKHFNKYIKSLISSIYSRKSCKTFVQLLIAVGFFGFFLPSLFNQYLPENLEMPLGCPSAITLDDEDHIYVTLEFYSRVQKYTPDGHFIKGWATSFAGGSTDIRYNKEKDCLDVAVSRLRAINSYTTEGILIESKPNEFQPEPDRFYELFPPPSTDLIEDSKGNSYTLEGQFFYPRIVQLDKEGKKETIICTPFYLLPLQAPFPIFFFFLLGIFLISRYFPKESFFGGERSRSYNGRVPEEC